MHNTPRGMHNETSDMEEWRPGHSLHNTPRRMQDEALDMEGVEARVERA